MIRLAAGVGSVLLVSLFACTSDAVEEVPNELLVRSEVGPSPELSLVERLRIGADEAVQFYVVADVDRAADGSIWVMEAGGSRILVFERDGSVRTTLGGQGGGPGEFESYPFWQDIRRDTVVVTEVGGRVHTFTADGTHIDTKAATRPEGSGLRLRRVTASETGWVADMEGRTGPTESGGPPTIRTTLYEFSLADGLGQPLGVEWSAETMGEPFQGFTLFPPFPVMPIWVVDGLGRLHASNSRDLRFETYSTGGTLERITELTSTPVPVPPEALEAWRDSKQCSPNNPECSEQLVAANLALEVPDYLPQVGRMYAYPDGSVAVLRPDLAPDPGARGGISVHDFFDAEGLYVGRVTGRIMPFWFDGEELLVVERDEMGVENVVVYEVAARE